MNILEIKQLIKEADICGHVPLISGLHGIGKSESASQYAKEKELHFEPLILSLMDTGDMLGLPVTETVGGQKSTSWAAPDWYTRIVNEAYPTMMDVNKITCEDSPLKEMIKAQSSDGYISRQSLNDCYCLFYGLSNTGLRILRQDKVVYADSKRSVLFLDEFNRAPSDILNASLQLILEHRLHSHILPRIGGIETLVIAAINPADGNYTVQDFDPALLDRFVECEVEPDLTSWLSWAKQNEVSQIVIDFLLDNKKFFHFTPEDGTKGASPRSWTRLSTYLKSIENTESDVMTYYIKGTVGQALASEFIMYYNSYEKGISLEKLLNILKTEAKIQRNPETISSSIEEEMNSIEAVKRVEYSNILLEQMSDESITKDEALIVLSFLYALPLENLGGVIKSYQSLDIQGYIRLASFDEIFNNKALFRKLAKHVSLF